MSDATAATIDEWWLREPEVARLLAALETDGAEARFVGGCVRNAVIGGGDTDLDIAINRPPEETRRLLETAEFPAHPTGVDHGTYTTVVETREGQTPIEVRVARRRDPGGMGEGGEPHAALPQTRQEFPIEKKAGRGSLEGRR